MSTIKVKIAIEMLESVERLARDRLGDRSMPIPPEMALILIDTYRDYLLRSEITCGEITKALHVIADFHTREDHEMGFLVERTRAPDGLTRWSDSDYYAAWKTLREFINLPTKGALSR